MAVLIVIWLLCGILCAVIANSKGRSVSGFALLGLLTGIVGVVIVLCVSAPTAREMRPARQSRTVPRTGKPLTWTED